MGASAKSERMLRSQFDVVNADSGMKLSAKG